MNKKIIKFMAGTISAAVLFSGISVFAEESNSDNSSLIDTKQTAETTDDTTQEILNTDTASDKNDNYDIFTYEVSDGGITITDVEDTVSKVTVPAEINGMPVTKIAGGAFGGSSNISEVYIADSVTEIGSTCFAYSTSIKRVKLSKALKSIPDGTFTHCDSLIGITIPYGVTKIGDSAFANCESLSSVSVASTVTEIADNAFSGSDNVFFYCKLSDEPYGVTYANSKGIQYDNLITVYLNGNEVDFDQAPITDHKKFRTLVPLRSVLEDMGANIRWYDDMDYAGLSIDGNRLLIKPGSEYMRVNDQTVYLSSPAIEYNERILLPIRDVVEAVGGTVKWVENSKSVFITYNK